MSTKPKPKNPVMVGDKMFISGSWGGGGYIEHVEHVTPTTFRCGRKLWRVVGPEEFREVRGARRDRFTFSRIRRATPEDEAAIRLRDQRQALKHFDWEKASPSLIHAAHTLITAKDKVPAHE